jgi:hypothetical protein
MARRVTIIGTGAMFSSSRLRAARAAQISEVVQARKLLPERLRHRSWRQPELPLASHGIIPAAGAMAPASFAGTAPLAPEHLASRAPYQVATGQIRQLKPLFEGQPSGKAALGPTPAGHGFSLSLLDCELVSGCGAARSGAPLVRDRRWAERATIPGLQRTIPLRSVLRCAREK